MAGAEVRALLIGLAARKLGVSADTLKVTDGVIHAPDGRKVGYGELTAETDLKREATAKVPPKPAAQHKIVGKSAPRIDIPAKMTAAPPLCRTCAFLACAWPRGAACHAMAPGSTASTRPGQGHAGSHRGGA